MEQVERIIQESITQLQINDLKIAAVRSLKQFAIRQYNTMVREFGLPSVFLLLMATLANDEEEPVKRLQAQNELNKRFEFELPVGVPLQTFAKTYIEQNVTPVLDELAKVNALDPDDVSGRNSLRNRAEMEVRYNEHLNSIEELRASGHKLVICSVHSDCSERCSHWQGRVYSLDGTSGTTSDGKSYIPLEVATDVYYTTRAGRVYKNGLLGFNCRHHLIPYQPGYKLPVVNPNVEIQQRLITQKQRQLERNVRAWKTRAIELKDINREEYLKARRKAIEWNKRYIAYSREHNRAYYPSRTKII